MSLISCPECGNKVSGRAIACPKCGFPIAREVEDGFSRQEGAPAAETEHAKKKANPEDTAENEPAGASEVVKFDDKVRSAKPYDGTGPWLRILSFFLIAGPIWEALGLNAQVYQIDLTSDLSRLVKWNYAVLVLQLLIGGSIVGQLRSQKDWLTIKVTSVVLWIFWPISSAIKYLILPNLLLAGQSPFNSGQMEVVLGRILVSTAVAAAWTIYLYRSKRVAATFDREYFAVQ